MACPRAAAARQRQGRETMAVPKKKTSQSRKGKRRANWHLAKPDPNKCPHCGAARLPHRVCRECGYYGEREVMVVEK